MDHASTNWMQCTTIWGGIGADVALANESWIRATIKDIRCDATYGIKQSHLRSKILIREKHELHELDVYDLLQEATMQCERIEQLEHVLRTMLGVVVLDRDLGPETRAGLIAIWQDQVNGK